MSMTDNSARSYGDVSFDKRLESTESGGMRASLEDVYDGPCDDYGTMLYSTTLASSKDQTRVVHVSYGSSLLPLSIEENDFLACAT